MKLAAIVAALVLSLVLASRPARAAGAVGALSEAQARLNAGDFYEARELTAPLLEDESLPRADRAEALRLHGLASFFLGDRAVAEASLLEYLTMEPQAHLDPALVPPVGIAFFEDVRARHWAEISKFIKKPKRRGYAVVNLLPPFGQFQNGDRAKGWALGASELLLGATVMTTYFMLQSRCNPTDCGDDPDTAKGLQQVNLTAFSLLVGVWLYGTIDGYLGWRRQEAEQGGSATVAGRGGAFDLGAVGVGVGEGGGRLVWTGTF